VLDLDAGREIVGEEVLDPGADGAERLRGGVLRDAVAETGGLAIVELHDPEPDSPDDVRDQAVVQQGIANSDLGDERQDPKLAEPRVALPAVRRQLATEIATEIRAD